MNPANHMLIASVVYDAVSRVDPGLLARAAFYWGNIAPDIAPTQAFRSHRAKFRLGMVNQKLARTMAAAGDDCDVWRRSYRLGVLCHYYADFCCYAHGDDYPKNLVRHMRHEHQLSRYARRRRELLEQLDFVWEKLPEESGALLGRLEAKRRFVCDLNAQGVNHGIELYGAIEAGCLLVFSYASFAGTMDFDRLLRPLCLAESA